MEILRTEQIRDISSLARALRKSDLPEEVIRQLPAQSLYMLLKYETIESAPELVEAATIEQTRLLLDFDLWEADSLVESRLWEWLEITSEEDDLIVLQKIVNSLDLKIVAYLVNKYVDIQQNEEATDAAPGPLFFTPDKGFTWIRVNAEEERIHFHISKLLAYLFESNADIFYQLMATKAVVTPSLLIDEALKDRSTRLSSEGFPEKDLALEVCSFISVAEALKIIESQSDNRLAADSLFAEPIVYFSNLIQPLSALLSEVTDLESALSEICLITNSCFVRFGISLSDFEQSSFLTSQVQGAINLGIEVLMDRTKLSSLDIMNRAGFQIPFRVGLSQILELNKLSKKYRTRLTSMPSESTQVDSLEIQIDPATQVLLDFLGRPFPCLPTALSLIKEDFALSGDNNSLDSRPAPFRFIKEVENIRNNLNQR